MRAFFGIELDSAWRDMLTAVGGRIREQDSDWQDAKWVAPQNLHVTLQFLGQIDSVIADEIPARLAKEFCHCEPFELPLDETVYAIPSPARAKMLWTTLLDPRGEGAGLAELVERVALSFGIDADVREYRPHITLARARRPKRFDLTSADGTALTPDITTPSTVSVQHATLYKSTLTRQGPVYEILTRVPLGREYN